MQRKIDWFLRRYAKMSGDEKIRISMRLSEMVRKMRMAGAKATNTEIYTWMPGSNKFLSR
jgi:hypothetical protein